MSQEVHADTECQHDGDVRHGTDENKVEENKEVLLSVESKNTNFLPQSNVALSLDKSNNPESRGKMPVFKVPLAFARPTVDRIIKVADGNSTGNNDALGSRNADKASDNEENELASKNEEPIKETFDLPDVKKPSEKDISLPYKEPQWSSKPPAPYSFEVLRGGIIVGSVDLSARPFTVCGRLPTCDLVMDHPSISRYHAVIQYRSASGGDGSHPGGFYLYDLDSTHGTQLNKVQIKGRIYYRLHVGHMIKFGGSTRTYILQGPEEDAEEESSLTVTEIKERQRQEEERLKMLQEKAREQREKEDEDEGIDWGMGEDAVEDDTVGEVNPFALDAPAANEDMYIDDPKKTLRGWFEREGYELEYDVQEKGQAHFLCRVELPLDSPTGGPVYAEASVKGKKKEAVAACALEACRILDRHGVLRQATHSSRQRKRKNWEEDDYYDSDEDTYLDQTGTIEKKRLQRKLRAGIDACTVDTYDTLVKKHEAVLKEIGEAETMMQKHSEKVEVEDSEVDSLDAYMKSIKNEKSLDKKEKTRIRIQLSHLKQEELKLRKLMAIAKPVSLPSIPKTVPVNKPKPVPLTKDPSATNSNPTEQRSEVELSDSAKALQTKPEATNNLVDSEPSVSKTDEAVTDITPETNKSLNPQHVTDKITNESDVSVVKKKEVKGHRANKKSMRKYEYDSSNPNYAMWIPPDDQSGDGRTSLNDKYGY